MAYKNMLLGALLTIGIFTCNLHGVEETAVSSAETTIESDAEAAAHILAEAIVTIAEISAEAQIRAAENYGRDTVKELAPLMGAALLVYALYQIRPIFLTR